MKESCRDSKMRALLHAYELGMISDEEKDLFEVHLLECDDCFEQLKEFAPRGSVLVASPQLRQLLEETHPMKDKSPALRQRLWRMFWPEEIPVLLRPAVLTVILLSLIYPAYLGIRSGKGKEVSLIQEIALMQTRSPETFIIRSGQGVVLSFLCPDTDSGNIYAVSLSDVNGVNLYLEENYSEADSYGVGRLMLPAYLVKPGTYRLKITPNGLSPDDSVAVEYVFRIDLVNSPE